MREAPTSLTRRERISRYLRETPPNLAQIAFMEEQQATESQCQDNQLERESGGPERAET